MVYYSVSSTLLPASIKNAMLRYVWEVLHIIRVGTQGRHNFLHSKVPGNSQDWYMYYIVLYHITLMVPQKCQYYKCHKLLTRHTCIPCIGDLFHLNLPESARFPPSFCVKQCFLIPGHLYCMSAVRKLRIFIVKICKIALVDLCCCSAVYWHNQ